MENFLKREAEKLTNLTVLVVDDQPGILRLLKDALELKRYRVFVATNVHQALDLVKEKRPELVILDISLGGQSGLTLAQDIKALWPKVKVVFITAYSEEELLNKAQEIAESVLIKPFGIETLYQEIQKVAARAIGNCV